jgi:hypothetical protein
MTTGKMAPMVMTGKVGLFPISDPLLPMKLTQNTSSLGISHPCP